MMVTGAVVHLDMHENSKIRYSTSVSMLVRRVVIIIPNAI